MVDLTDEQANKCSSAVGSRRHSILVDRVIITQKSFNKVFIPTEYDDRTPANLLRQTRKYVQNKCIPSKKCCESYVKILFPFLSWIKIYQKDWLPYDIIAGITVFYFHCGYIFIVVFLY